MSGMIITRCCFVHCVKGFKQNRLRLLSAGANEGGPQCYSDAFRPHWRCKMYRQLTGCTERNVFCAAILPYLYCYACSTVCVVPLMIDKLDFEVMNLVGKYVNVNETKWSWLSMRVTEAYFFIRSWQINGRLHRSNRILVIWKDIFVVLPKVRKFKKIFLIEYNVGVLELHLAIPMLEFVIFLYTLSKCEAQTWLVSEIHETSLK